MAAASRDRPHPLRLINGGAEGIRSTLDPHEPGRSSPDMAILAALRAREPRAAARLHDRIRPQIDRTLRRLLGRNDPDHQDLAQDALIVLISSIDAFRGECSLDSWAATLTARAVYKYFRRKKLDRRLFSHIGDDEEFESANSASPSRSANARQLLSRIREHLEAMEQGRAWAYVLHDVCGHELKEIAQIMGISSSAAQSRLVRGRKEIYGRIRNDPELANALAEGDP